MSEEQVEYVVDNVEGFEEVVDIANIEQWKIDRMLEEVKENNEDLIRYEEIMNNRISEIKLQFEEKKNQITKQNNYKLSTLGEYAKTQKLKKAKTQSKLPLLSGDIIIKHASKSFTKPKKANESKLAELYPEHTTKEEVIKTNWVEIKKNLVMQNNKVYDQETGEDLTDIIEVVEKDEEVIIK